jgi:hypothetical protein
VPCRKQKLQASSLTSTVPSKPTCSTFECPPSPHSPTLGWCAARAIDSRFRPRSHSHTLSPTYCCWLPFPFSSSPSLLPPLLLTLAIYIFSRLNLTHHTSSQLIDSNQGSLVSSIGPLTSSYSLPSQRVFHHLYHLTREPPPLTLNPRAGSHTHHADSTTTHQRTKLACDKAVYSLL